MDQEKKLILVTWDFSEIAEKAVKHAIRISKIVENDIALFHVTKYEKDIPDLEKKLQEETARLEETYGHKISFILRQGTIFGEISNFATNKDNRVNFVIMGTHGMKGAQKLFGSWALKVIAGYEGIFCGFAAIYTGLAQVINEVFEREVAPLGAIAVKAK